VKSEAAELVDAPMDCTEPGSTGQVPADFVEWELLCVTLHDWEHIAERFEKPTHYLEKALYKILTQSIVPSVTESLKEIEHKRQMEEAITHRKRSSRIAVKESEKEEARLAAKKREEETERDARAHRAEARAKKEEEERAKRELAREQRRIEREEREQRAARMEKRREREQSEEHSNAAGPSQANGTRATRPKSKPMPAPAPVPAPAPRRPEPSDTDWILDCEICKIYGQNMDDGLPMVSCGSCNKWQHITCHDVADQRLGRPKRNWNLGQFFCRRCQAERNRSMLQASQYAAATYAQKAGQSNHLQTTFPQSGSHPRFTETHQYAGSSSLPSQYQQPQRHPASLTMTQPRPEYSMHNQHLGYQYQRGVHPPVPSLSQTSQSPYIDGRSTPESQQLRQQPYAQPYPNGTYSQPNYSNGAGQNPSHLPYNRPPQPDTNGYGMQLNGTQNGWNSYPTNPNYHTSSTPAGGNIPAPSAAYGQGSQPVQNVWRHTDSGAYR